MFFRGKNNKEDTNNKIKEENKNKQDLPRINFFKKIYYSILKLKKYGELSNLGLKKAVYYVMDLLLVVGLIYSTIYTLQVKKSINGLREYLTKNLPEFTYEDNAIKSDLDKRAVLDDKLVVTNFGGKIIIDFITDYDILLEEYRENEEPIILLTNDKFTTITSNGDVNDYSYEDIVSNSFGEDVKSFNKDDLMYQFDNVSYGFYFVTYVISYVVAHSILVFVYAFIMAILVFTFCKIKKMELKFSETYSMALYAVTTSVFTYLVANFLSGMINLAIRIAFAIIPIINLSIAVYVNKWLTPDIVGRKKKKNTDK